MKLIFATLLVLASINAFAAAKQPKASRSCQAAVLRHAAKIKNDAKSVVRSVEDQLDEGLNRDGDPTIGMSTRGNSQGAQLILDAVREIQQDGHNPVLSDETNEWLIQLCSNKLNVDQALENY